MPATGADIPVELISIVMSLYSVPDTPQQEDASVLDGYLPVLEHELVDKRRLGRCALVCRTWATICQKEIFSNITLRSREDVIDLFSLAGSPHSLISQHIYQPRLHPSGTGTPWIHFLHAKVKLRTFDPDKTGVPFPNCWSFSLDVRNRPTLEYVRRGIHSLLPRSPAPLSFSSGITTLYLVSHEFQGLGDVVKVADKLPSLELLSCIGLSWVKPPKDEPDLSTLIPQRASIARAFPLECCMHQCADLWAVLPLLRAMYGRTHCRLNDADFRVMCKLCKTMMDDLEEQLGEDLQEFQARVYAIMDPKQSLFWFGIGEYVIVPELEFVLARHPEGDRVGSLIMRFTNQSEKQPMMDLEDMFACKWETMDELIASFADIHTVVLALSSLDDVYSFAHDIEPKLNRLRFGGKLRYAVLYDDQLWVACTPESRDEDLDDAAYTVDSELHVLYPCNITPRHGVMFKPDDRALG